MHKEELSSEAGYAQEGSEQTSVETGAAATLTPAEEEKVAKQADALIAGEGIRPENKQYVHRRYREMAAAYKREGGSINHEGIQSVILSEVWDSEKNRKKADAGAGPLPKEE